MTSITIGTCFHCQARQWFVTQYNQTLSHSHIRLSVCLDFSRNIMNTLLCLHPFLLEQWYRPSTFKSLFSKSVILFILVSADHTAVPHYHWHFTSQEQKWLHPRLSNVVSRPRYLLSDPYSHSHSNSESWFLLSHRQGQLMPFRRAPRYTFSNLAFDIASLGRSAQPWHLHNNVQILDPQPHSYMPKRYRCQSVNMSPTTIIKTIFNLYKFTFTVTNSDLASHSTYVW